MNGNAAGATNTVTVASGATLGGIGTIGGAVSFNAGSHAVFTNGATLTLTNSLIIVGSGTIPDVHLNLPAGLAGYRDLHAGHLRRGRSSGAFNPTPVINSGSLASGASASISTSGGVVSLTVANITPNGTGLTGDYFTANNFTGTKTSRVDATVNFDWGTGSPGFGGLGTDNFSIRWSGQIEPRYGETYTFYVTADDGATLWVNDRLIVSRLFSATPAQMAGQITLKAGQRVNLRLEFIEKTNNASVLLEWASASQAREVVPQSQLYPTTMPAERGSILREHWANLPGTAVTALTSSTNYPEQTRRARAAPELRVSPDELDHQCWRACQRLRHAADQRRLQVCRCGQRYGGAMVKHRHERGERTTHRFRRLRHRLSATGRIKCPKSPLAGRS